MDNKAYWLLAELVFGIGGKRLWEFIPKNGDPEALCKGLAGAEGLTAGERDRAAHLRLSDAEALLNEAYELGQSVTCISDEDFPERLKDLDDCPAVLFYRGDIGLAAGDVLHMVGTRKPTKYTASLVRVLCHELTVRDFVLSGGMAEGVDTRVIEETLSRGGRILSVLPCPLEADHPKDNGGLKERLAAEGLVISEQPPESKARMNFQRRNKLAVALSKAVIVAEAHEDSKGLDNCKQAERLGRPVFAVPPHLLYSKEYFGQRDLLRAGAEPLFDGSDIVRVLTERGDIRKDTHGTGAAVRTENASAKTAAKSPEPVFSRELAPEEKAVTELLKKHGSLTLEEICEAGGTSAFYTLPVITGLELDGILTSTDEGKYKLN
ncbi:DNA-processing protein DprA [Ruminococcus sp.]|uniref:DNA-processing protein DprA n=1 Tax=Ruminococcus sp. TaxID=41978 RepID=UPI0025D01D09|nr:DNA-processing protein DprA [Ruminococcus sp.]MBQ8965119.1 DNA-processing protein DprA [Ruminococcus sp.]